MARQHASASASTACIWTANSSLMQAVASRLLCWADGAGKVNFSTDPIPHFEVQKAWCGTQGALQFIDGGTDYCPLGDDTTISLATPLDPETCGPPVIPDDQIVQRLTAAEAALLRALYKDIAQTVIDGPMTFDAPDAATTMLQLEQNNAVTSSDANMLEVFYQAFNTLRLNELGLPRFITPPASTGLGKEGETTVQIHAGTSTSKALRILDHTGVENAFFRGNGTLQSGAITSTGTVLGTNLLESAWVPIVINSPQTAGKYTSAVDGSNNDNSAQVRIYDGGKKAELRGRIDVVTTGGVTDEIIATTMPTSITLGSGTASAVPIRRRGAMAMGSGGGLRIQILNTGEMQLLGAALTQPFIRLDGFNYSLES